MYSKYILVTNKLVKQSEPIRKNKKVSIYSNKYYETKAQLSTRSNITYL